MGSSQLETISKFIVSDEKNWRVGLDVHRALPQIMESVCSDFLGRVWAQTGFEDPDGIWGQWRYRSPRIKSCLYCYRKSWQSVNLGKQQTQIRLEAEDGVNQWSIGVASSNTQLIGANQAGYKELKGALDREFGDSERSWEGWVWWQWIDEQYGNWASLIPTLHQECEEGSGEVMTYFAEKLASVANVAVPIIDRYEDT